MNSLRRGIAGGISLLIYALITLLSSLPSGSLPSGVPDFIPHASEFFLLGFFFIQVFPAPGRRPTMAVALLLLAGLGLLDEWHQLFVPGRVFSLLDWLYDISGALAGLAAFLVLSRHSNK